MNLTYYFPFGPFFPIRSGAAAVAARHLEYFRSRRIRPRLMLLGNCSLARQRLFRRHYHWVGEICFVEPRLHPRIGRLYDVWELGNQLAAHAELCELPELRELAARPTDVFFSNYVFSAPLTDLFGPNVARVLESCDIMSKQFQTSRMPAAAFQHHLRAEFDLYELYDLVLMINQDEAEFARGRTSTRIEYVPRPIDRLAAGQPAEEPQADQYDILFIGSKHPPNHQGIQWFYRHVFMPYLKERGLRWAIAGSVGESSSIADRSVHILGPVDDLDALYRKSKVVVVPLFAGSGISLKTLEALGKGKPVVTTPVGARGLPDAGDSFIAIDFEADPRAVAARIEALCRSETLRSEYASRAVAFIARNFDHECYRTRMDELLLPFFGRRSGSRPEGENASDATFCIP